MTLSAYYADRVIKAAGPAVFRVKCTAPEKLQLQYVATFVVWNLCHCMKRGLKLLAKCLIFETIQSRVGSGRVLGSSVKGIPGRVDRSRGSKNLDTVPHSRVSQLTGVGLWSLALDGRVSLLQQQLVRASVSAAATADADGHASLESMTPRCFSSFSYARLPVRVAVSHTRTVTSQNSAASCTYVGYTTYLSDRPTSVCR